MIINDKIYDILKYVALIFLPALAVFLGTVLEAIGCEFTSIIVIIVNALALFLGSLLKVSTDKYNGIS